MRYIRANTTRRKLPNRRPAETRNIEDHGLAYTATFGCFPDGSIGEIFLQNHKPGSQADANARDAAVAASLALQYGCPLEVLKRALLRDSRGRPSTPLGAALDAISGGSS
jgi:ribonucleoside-diphosphate reductase alpha chain